MAKLRKKLFGNLSGTFGDAVYRQLGKKNYVAQKPSTYKKPDTLAFKNRTRRFALSVKFGKIIYRNDSLRAIWIKEYPLEKQLFNFIVRENYPFISPDGISSKPLLTPFENGFGVTLSSSEVTDSSVIVEIAPLGTVSNIDVNIEKKIRLISVLILTDPLEEGYPPFNIFSFESDDLPVSILDSITFNILNSSNHTERIQKYGQKQAFFALVTLDDDNLIINYSGTFAALS